MAGSHAISRRRQSPTWLNETKAQPQKLPHSLTKFLFNNLHCTTWKIEMGFRKSGVKNETTSENGQNMQNESRWIA